MSEPTGEYQKARAVKEFYAARLARLTFDDREVSLVSSDEIAEANDARTAEEMLEVAIRDALMELSGVMHEDDSCSVL